MKKQVFLILASVFLSLNAMEGDSLKRRPVPVPQVFDQDQAARRLHSASEKCLDVCPCIVAFASCVAIFCLDKWGKLGVVFGPKGNPRGPLEDAAFFG